MTSSSAPRRLLLEGRPGVGKTTAVDRLARLLQDAGVPLAGFVTREIRQGRRRVGFSITTMEGRQGTLAHIELRGPPKVGKYGVDLDVLERIAVPALQGPSASGVVIIDELGKMELALEAFRDAVDQVFEGPCPVVATVQVARHPFTDELKRRVGTETLRVTCQNRDQIPRRIAGLLT